MRVVLKVWSGNPNWDGRCDYAMVDLTPEFAALALGRIGTVREQQATDPELNESYFWDSHAAYFSLWAESGTQPGFGCEAGQATTLEDLRVDQREVVQVPEGFQLTESQLARVECEQMIVRKVCGRQHTSQICWDIGYVSLPHKAPHLKRVFLPVLPHKTEGTPSEGAP
jgi:hypothetical protein